MLWHRFTRRPRPEPPAAPHACAELDALPVLSPLLTELLALGPHARDLSRLSTYERCPDEYRLAARSVIRHLLEGWQNQTGGRGTIDDLLLPPSPPPACPEPPPARTSRTHWAP